SRISRTFSLFVRVSPAYPTLLPPDSPPKTARRDNRVSPPQRTRAAFLRFPRLASKSRPALARVRARTIRCRRCRAPRARVRARFLENFSEQLQQPRRVNAASLT